MAIDVNPPTPRPSGMDWLISECRAHGGFFIETAHHMLAYIPGKERMVVSFDNLVSPREIERRVPFGYSFLRSFGWGVLGVMVKRVDWFQCPDLKGQLIRLRDDGLFDAYEDVSFYGASMGGFGALAFSSLAPGASVFAMSPQSTLRPRKVPFETRYTRPMKRGDWSEPFSDAAGALGATGPVTIIYDPTVLEDRLHVERIEATNDTPLNLLEARHFTHKIPPMLKKMDILKPVTQTALTGTLTRADFYSLIRARRTAAPYLVEVLRKGDEAGHTVLARHAAHRAVDLQNNWKTRQARKNLDRKFRELRATDNATDTES